MTDQRVFEAGTQRSIADRSGRSTRRDELAVLPTHDALIETAARLFVSAAAEAIAAGDRFVVALSGGATPHGLYTLLATTPYAARVDWSRVHILWGDERCVPPDHPASNYRKAREALLDHVPLAAQNVHRIRGEDMPPAAAAAYERELRELFGTPLGQPRTTPGARFDLILLGLGDDGHTASLFPASAALREASRWVVAEPVAADRCARVTLTPMVINAAAQIVFVVSGRTKATSLQRALAGPIQPDALPAHAIAPHAGQLRWLADADAAVDLDSG